MKEMCGWIVAMIMAIFAVRYALQTKRGEIMPTLSTWIIFQVGTGLSLATYMVAERHDFLSGILNLMDVVADAVVLVAILVWGDRTVRFKPFERWYLLGLGLIVAYGFLTGDAWRSNIFTQVLITLGYIPTVQNLVKVGRNVESFSGWGCGLAAGCVGLYPALTDGNTLAVLYAARTVFLTGCTILLMLYFEFRPRSAG